MAGGRRCMSKCLHQRASCRFYVITVFHPPATRVSLVAMTGEWVMLLDIEHLGPALERAGLRLNWVDVGNDDWPLPDWGPAITVHRRPSSCEPDEWGIEPLDFINVCSQGSPMLHSGLRLPSHCLGVQAVVQMQDQIHDLHRIMTLQGFEFVAARSLDLQRGELIWGQCLFLHRTDRSPKSHLLWSYSQ